MWFFPALLVAISILGVCIGQTAKIIEHPKTQHVLVSDETTFYCKTFGLDAFWLINSETVSETHLATKQRYESLGFSFSDSNHGTLGYHNLTMNVSASATLNRTMIQCTVLDRNYFQIESNVAYFYVLTDLRPYTPALATAMVRCWEGLSPLVLHGSIRVQPRWTGYDIAEFRIDITNGSNGMILKQTSIPYSGREEDHYFDVILPGCVNSLDNSSILVSATTYSSTYGESVPSPEVEAKIDRALGNFSEQAINHTVYFYPNGTPFLFLEIKPPSAICSCQKVAYTIEIEDINTGQFQTLGPWHHMGPKVLIQNLISAILERDHNYTATVTVESSGEISTTKSYLFNTTLKLILEPCDSNARDDTFLFQLGMSVGLFIAVVIMSILVILMLSVFVYHKREQIFITLAARRVHNSCPIQSDWPVYDSIHPASKTTINTDKRQPEVSHASSGQAQHNHLNKTGFSIFQENVMDQPPIASMETNKREGYENDTIG